MIYFLLGFAQVALVSIQSRNYAQSRYLGAAICSLCIASIWWFIVHDMATTPTTFSDGLGYITGNTLGGTFGIWIHKRFFKKKDTKDW